MTCEICIKWKDKLSGTNAFITGSRNFKSSAVAEHAQSKLHKQALRLEESEQATNENRKARVHVPPPTSDAPIVQAVSNMGRITAEEKAAMQRLFDIAYLLAYKGRPYSDFIDHIEIEKLHGVNFMPSSAYENDMGCKLFIHFAAKALYELELKDKIKRANFVTVLSDGATDAACIEKEVVYILFVDPDEFKASLAFLSLKSVPSQDAQGITSAIIDAFKDCDILDKLQRIVFFESDGTAVNSGLKNGVIKVLQEKFGSHIKFFWCLSHRLELAVKDAIQEDMKEVETALRDLYYVYQNSGKRLRELRSLYEILKDVYSFENKQVKPSKASGTRWIDHKLRAMKAFVDKRGLYLSHIQNVIADTSKKNDKATLEGKRRRIARGSVLLKCAMYTDILEPVRQLSIMTQKTSEVNIVKQVEVVDSTLNKYRIMENRAEKAEEVATSVLPTVKHVLSVITQEGQSAGQQCKYQGVAVGNLQQAKTQVNSLVKTNITAIHKSLARRYGSLVDDTEGESSKETRDADEIAHCVAKVLNTRVWMREATEETLGLQMEAIEKISKSFKDMEPLNRTNSEQLKETYTLLVQWATMYFDVATIDPMDLWPRLQRIKHDEAPGLFALIELCLCCPYGNSVCESFISYLRVIKTDWRNKLNESNLTDLMRIKVTGPTVPGFNKRFCGLAVDLWNSEKVRRTNQGQRRKYAERRGTGTKTREMERKEFLKAWLKDAGADYEEEGGTSDDEEETEEDMDADESEEDDSEVETTLMKESQAECQSRSESSHERESNSEDDDPLLCGMRSSDSDLSDED